MNMKIKILKCIMTTLFVVAFVITNAQIRTKIFNDSIPSSLIAAKASGIPEKIIPMPDGFLEALNEIKTNKKSTDYSNSFALSKSISLDVMSNATVTEDKGFTIYIMTINAEKARNVSLQFSKFFLPKNSILKIYNQFELTDSITSKENNDNNVWATRVYQGNKLTIELKLQGNDKEMPSLVIDKINFGYKQFGTEYFGNPGASAACNINIVCPEGVGWENERNSIALIVANGSTSCTGSLIMNTCNTNIPYFLTANHCLAAGNVANWVFQFQTWSATCNPNGAFREDVQFNGCTLRANNAASDFALLQLNNTPIINSGITYSGWNRNVAAPNGSVSIHHPAGDLMKFSRDFDPSGVSSWGGTNNHWVSVFEQGTVQPGSSGSPLYDMNHRIVGQLHGDQQNQGNYCAQRRGEYGKLDNSWTGGGTNATRLSDWLDPSNSGVLTTNTTGINNLTQFVNTNNINISGSQIICNSSDYFVTNLPVGATVVWSIPGSAGPVLQLSPNTPAPNQLRITNQKWYGVTTTLTAVISNLGCGVPNQTRILTIANDNSTSASIPFSYYQESCSFYNISHPSQSGSIYSNSSPVFVHQGCMVYVNLGDMTGKTVSLQSGSGQPLYWGTIGGTSYFPYSQNLIFQLPLGSGGIPFTFQISGDGACYTRTLLFFSYSGNSRYAYAATPNPTKDLLIVTAKEDEKYLAENKLNSTREKLQFIMNIYNLSTNTLQMTQRSSVGSMQHSLNVSNLKTGYYVLQIVNGKETQSIKFFKE